MAQYTTNNPAVDKKIEQIRNKNTPEAEALARATYNLFMQAAVLEKETQLVKAGMRKTDLAGESMNLQRAESEITSLMNRNPKLSPGMEPRAFIEDVKSMGARTGDHQAEIEIDKAERNPVRRLLRGDRKGPRHDRDKKGPGRHDGNHGRRGSPKPVVGLEETDRLVLADISPTLASMENADSAHSGVEHLAKPTSGKAPGIE